MSGRAVEVTDANFAEITGKGVALVDFWALRCPPCRVQGPIVDKLATDFAERATVGKLDVDANPEIPTKFKLMYIPTLILFRHGREVKRFTGLTQAATLASELEEALMET
ncbi:MAG: thioredoxin [Planctomycetes bacterium]|nr:thioredoxin [Planctomycetota bacterium]